MLLTPKYFSNFIKINYCAVTIYLYLKHPVKLLMTVDPHFFVKIKSEKRIINTQATYFSHLSEF